MFKELLAIRHNVKLAFDKEHNINHIITFLSNTEDEFIVDIFTDGVVSQLNPRTKELVSAPKLISTVRTTVKYADLIRFIRVVEKMIAHYDKTKTIN